MATTQPPSAQSFLSRMLSPFTTTAPADAVAERFRWILIGLALMLGMGTLAELAMLRHWITFTQVIPWIVVGVSMVACLMWAVIRTPLTALIVRATAGVSILGALYGIWEHIEANLESAPFGSVWADVWPTLSPLQQFWEAASGGVDLTPPLAPGFAALCGLCALLSTLWWKPGT